MSKIIVRKNLDFFPIWIFIFKFLISILIGFIFWTVISPGKYQVSHSFIGIFTGWDSAWYTQIAQSGYTVSNNNSITAFFPLYPLLIYLTHFISHRSLDLCAFFISNISLLIALIFLYKITLHDHGESTAKKTLWIYITFPSALFLSIGYSESVSLLFIVLYFYSLQKRNWYSSIFFAGLATLTHDLGVLLFFSSLLYWYQERKMFDNTKRIIRFLSLFLIPISLFLYMAYLWITWSSPIEFMLAQNHWDRHMIFPVFSVIQLLYQIPHLMEANDFKFLLSINCLSTLLFFFLLIPTFRDKTISPEQKIFYFITFFVSVSSDAGNAAQSYARFMLMLFPGFIILAKLIKNEVAFMSIVLFMFSLECILLGMFADGYLVN